MMSFVFQMKRFKWNGLQWNGFWSSCKLQCSRSSTSHTSNAMPLRREFRIIWPAFLPRFHPKTCAFGRILDEKSGHWFSIGFLLGFYWVSIGLPFPLRDVWRIETAMIQRTHSWRSCGTGAVSWIFEFWILCLKRVDFAFKTMNSFVNRCAAMRADALRWQ